MQSCSIRLCYADSFNEVNRVYPAQAREEFRSSAKLAKFAYIYVYIRLLSSMDPGSCNRTVKVENVQNCGDIFRAI